MEIALSHNFTIIYTLDIKACHSFLNHSCFPSKLNNQKYLRLNYFDDIYFFYDVIVWNYQQTQWPSGLQDDKLRWGGSLGFYLFSQLLRFELSLQIIYRTLSDSAVVNLKASIFESIYRHPAILVHRLFKFGLCTFQLADD